MIVESSVVGRNGIRYPLQRSPFGASSTDELPKGYRVKGLSYLPVALNSPGGGGLRGGPGGAASLQHRLSPLGR